MPTKNPFDKDQWLVELIKLDADVKFQTEKNLVKFRQNHLHQNNFNMSIQEKYIKLVHFVTTNAVLATLIMFVALSGVGAAAAQAIAPEKYKPSNILGITKPQDKKTTNPVENAIEQEEPKKEEPKVETKLAEPVKQQTPTPANTPAQPVVQPTPQPLNSTVTLKNASGFKKSNIVRLDCNTTNPNPALGAWTRYSGSSSTMNIYGPENKGKMGDQEAQAIVSFNNLLQGKPRDNDVTGIVSGLFNEYCSGFAARVINEMNGLNLANANTTKIYLTLEGQDVGGDLNIELFAKRGESLISVRMPVAAKDSDINYDQYKNECYAPNPDNAKADACYISKVLSPQNLKLAQQRAEKLVADYQLLP